MTIAATVDLHCAVKIKSLEFWNDVIGERLKNQGMIDGDFPDVTFSKERKKIVRLDEDEIKRRLNIVLNELNINGCLEVLVKTIQDDPDIEVIEVAVKITKQFVELLKKYKLLQQENRYIVGGNYKNFFNLINQDLDNILVNKKKWLKTTDAFALVLNDMLKELEQDEDMNVMECYY